MLELVRPRSFLPVHGTIHHLTRHAALAREVGVEDVAVAENGRVVEVTESGVALGATLPTGRVHVWAGREVAPEVLRERTFLAQEGVAVALVTVDPAGTASEVFVTTRGLLPADAPEIREVERAVRAAVAEVDSASDDGTLSEHVRLAVRRAFYKAVGVKPMTIVHIRRSP
jgi:ribonuclease J